MSCTRHSWKFVYFLFHNIFHALGIIESHNDAFLYFAHVIPSLSLVAFVTPSCNQEDFSNATCEQNRENTVSTKDSRLCPVASSVFARSGSHSLWFRLPQQGQKFFYWNSSTERENLNNVALEQMGNYYPIQRERGGTQDEIWSFTRRRGAPQAFTQSICPWSISFHTNLFSNTRSEL